MGQTSSMRAAVPRQHDAGILGYVAEVEQFDDSITTPEPPADREPPATTEQSAEPLPVAPEAIAPEPEPEPRVTNGGAGATVHVPEKERGRRAEVVVAAVLAVLAALSLIAVGYAVTGERRPAGEVALPMAELPATGGAVETPGAGAIGADPTPPDRDAERAAGAEPTDAATGTPSPAATPSPATPPAELHATYARATNTGLLGLGGYRGEVTVRNDGGGSASTWTVTLTLPAGQEVTAADGAAFRQDGTTVAFTAAGGAPEVGPRESVRFTFDVPGLLAGEPTGCAIDGQPCG